MTSKRRYLLFLLISGLTFILFTNCSSSDSSPEPETTYACAWVDPNVVYQTMDGFGGSIAWYDNWLHSSDHNVELYDLLFHDLGLDILRLRNIYGRSDSWHTEHELLNFAKLSYEAGNSRNPDLQVLLTSWTPPASLKDNNKLTGGGRATLKRKNDIFVYDDFADYWATTLQKYEQKGISIDYISIQNEPNYDAAWESCLFWPTETEINGKLLPGYDTALDKVFQRLSSLPDRPKLIGPEVTGFGENNIPLEYLGVLDQSQLDVIAYHLYGGGDPDEPDSYISKLRSVADHFPDKTIWQTEFDWATPFHTAWLIHNTLVEGRVSAYFHWSLAWPDKNALIRLHSFDGGYTINEYYYYFKQFSRFISRGDRRVSASADNNNILISAYTSPDNKHLTVVLINTGHSNCALTIEFNGLKPNESEIYRTGVGDRFRFTGSLDSDNTIKLPPKSVSTIRLYEKYAH